MKTKNSCLSESEVCLGKKQKPFITPKEARKVLGAEITSNLDDKEIENIVAVMGQIAKLLIVNVIKPDEEIKNE